jgi:hypothetical protein
MKSASQSKKLILFARPLSQAVHQIRTDFDIQSWVKAYETLAAYNQYHEVMVAFDPDTNA